MRKQARRKTQAGMHPLDVFAACRPYPEAEATTILLRAREALDHLKNGGTDTDLFDRVGAVLNVGLARSEQIGGADSPAVQAFRDAQFALMQCDTAMERHGRYGFTGAGLQAMVDAYTVYEQILRASSPRQMHMAMQECIRRMHAAQGECPSHMERKAA